MLGKDVDYKFEWISVYTFQCRRMQRFVHDRIIFAGDAAHLVSPFGARGATSGVADVENLVWKLDLVLTGRAGAQLLETYNEEATVAADVNILNSTRSTDFITPKSPASRALRNAVLELSTHCPFARPLVNSGRLATAVPFPASSLNTPDRGVWSGGVAPGYPALDAPLQGATNGWLLQQLGGVFTLMAFANERSARELHDFVGSMRAEAPMRLLVLSDECDISDLAAERYDALPGTLYLFRPDQYVAARWRRFDPHAVTAALRKACGHTADEQS
jgi:3-(3-hydroxy-phenyl)propionate hydroxylase